ncbi:hypothetical protein [Limimaricola pyoseonensis]|nr:hypothetical protein [Limimaricola pyoseonensis]
MIRFALLAPLAFAVAGPAAAQSLEGAAFGAGVSSLGLYASGSYEVMPKLRLRGVVAGAPDLQYEGDEDEAGTEITLDGNFVSVAALADYFPYANGFRVSGGVFFLAENTLDGTGSGFEADDGTSYDAATVTASARFEQDVAPALAIGYQGGLGGGWGFETEIGVIAIGSVEVDLDGTSGEAGAREAQFQSDLAAVEADANDMGESLPVWPWLSIGVTYRF